MIQNYKSNLNFDFDFDDHTGNDSSEMLAKLK
jgi:hypothetical protein